MTKGSVIFITSKFTGAREYVKKLRYWCYNPSEMMSARNVNDAKKECDGEKRSICDMFYQSDATQESFYACEESATIAHSGAAPILFQLLPGNKKCMQYKYFKILTIYDSLLLKQS